MPYVFWGDRDAIAEFEDEAEALRLARQLLEDGFPLAELWLDAGDDTDIIQGAELVRRIRTLYPSARLSA
jgi:L-alanine-DL-glutamate epimerase-like enolase superfamily enzyme